MKRRTIIVAAIAFVVCFVGFSYMMSRPDAMGPIDTTLHPGVLFFFIMAWPSSFIASLAGMCFGDKEDTYDC